MATTTPDFVQDPPTFKDANDIPFRRLESAPGSGQGPVEFVTGTTGKYKDKEYALKVFKLEATDRSVLAEDKRKFLAEVQYLHRARHHHVTALIYAYFLDTGNDYTHGGVVMDRMQPFKRHVERPASPGKSQKQLGQWFGCLASAIDYLHGIGFRHRDIKPDNILVKDGNVLLADFGISKVGLGKTLSTTRPDDPRGRTAEYCPPEVEFGSSRGRSADIFALGAVFLEMLVAHSYFDQRRKLTAALVDADDSQRWSFGRQLFEVHKFMKNLRGTINASKLKRAWHLEVLSLCEDMLHEDRDERPVAFKVSSSLSRFDATAPCTQCTAPPQTDAAKLLQLCRNGSAPEVQALLEANPDLTDTGSALQQASICGNLRVVESLLSNGFRADVSDETGQTALHCAAGHGHGDIVNLLLEKGASAEILDRGRCTVLHYAAASGDVEIVSKLLSSWKKALGRQDKNGQTALHFAAGRGRIEVVLRLLEEDTQKQLVNLHDSHGRTALHLAAGYGSEAVVKILLKSGADVNVRTNKHWTALHFGAKGIQRNGQYLAVIKLILEKQPDKRALRRLVYGDDSLESRHKDRWELLSAAAITSPSPKADLITTLSRMTTPPRQFSASDIEGIRHLLEQRHPRWYEEGHRVEKLYTVLSISITSDENSSEAIDESVAKAVDKFLENGVTDDNLPLAMGDPGFVGVLRPGAQRRFLSRQATVLI